VATLSQSDIEVLLSLSSELAATDDAITFPPSVLARLAELLPDAEVNYCELDRSRECSLSQSWLVDGEGGIDRPADKALQSYFALRHQHPVCRYREGAHDWVSVRKVSDFVTLRDFRRTEIWNELYRDDNVNYWIDVGLDPHGAETYVFIFTRQRRDFDERDRLMLQLIRPHLQRRHTAAKLTARSVDMLATLEEERGSDEAHQVVLCSATGVIDFASPRSRSLLSRYLRISGGRLPESLLGTIRHDRRAVVVEHQGRRLTVRASHTAGMLILLLDERDIRLDRLTRRQLEIVRHIALGYTDAQVGSALGIATATVNKHLEKIYERLGVHTRTAAAALLSNG
jgi:DNA-binding CsgD family transcriptional regulator